MLDKKFGLSGYLEVKRGAEAPSLIFDSKVESLVNAPRILFWLQKEERNETKFVAKRSARIKIAVHQLFRHRVTLLVAKIEAIVANNVEVHPVLADCSQLTQSRLLLGETFVEVTVDLARSNVVEINFVAIFVHPDEANSFGLHVRFSAQRGIGKEHHLAVAIEFASRDDFREQVALFARKIWSSIARTFLDEKLGTLPKPFEVRGGSEWSDVVGNWSERHWRKRGATFSILAIPMFEVREDVLVAGDGDNFLHHAHFRANHIARLLAGDVARESFHHALVLDLNRSRFLDSFLRICLQFDPLIGLGVSAAKVAISLRVISWSRTRLPFSRPSFVDTFAGNRPGKRSLHV